jgi:hypothetical protein
MNYYDLLKAGSSGFAPRKKVGASDYARIAQVVRSGKAEDFFRIGDQVMTTYTDTSGNTYDMPWDVVAFRTVTDADGNEKPGMILQSHYATVEEIAFDASEPDRPAEEDYQGQIKEYGWNRWLKSAYRQWLNSAEEKGHWWTSQNAYDVAPAQAATVNGFMKGLPAEFLAMSRPVKVETVRNYRDPDVNPSPGVYEYDTTYDQFWLPSKEEEYTVPNEPNHKEGLVWPYWVDTLTAPALEKGETLPQQNWASAEATHALLAHRRFALNSHNSAVTVRLRSAHRSNSNYVWYINSTGNVANYYARTAYRSAPACAVC